MKPKQKRPPKGSSSWDAVEEDIEDIIDEYSTGTHAASPRGLLKQVYSIHGWTWETARYRWTAELRGRWEACVSRWESATEVNVLRLTQQGYNAKAISAELGLAPGIVTTFRKRLDLVTRQAQRKKPDLIDIIRSCAEAGRSVEATATYVKLSSIRVRALAIEANIVFKVPK